jgi:hypothetical protein
MRSRDQETKKPKKVIQLDHSVSAIPWWLSVTYKGMSKRKTNKTQRKKSEEEKTNGWGWTILACHFAFYYYYLAL